MHILDSQQTAAVLDYLGVQKASPSLAHLDVLVAAYTRRVPWESASRIALHGMHAPDACVRWPDAFWQQARTHGTGGTCFESNLAFLALLRALGYQAELTINDMNETVGCHTALIVTLDNARWVVDVGYPVSLPLALDPTQTTRRETTFGPYSATPVQAGRYRIVHTPGSELYLFDLIDAPISEPAYCAATAADHGPNGLFLDRVVIRKVVNECVWRFDSAATPAALQQFIAGERIDHPIEDDVATTLSAHFALDRSVLAAALATRGPHDARSDQTGCGPISRDQERGPR